MGPSNWLPGQCERMVDAHFINLAQLQSWLQDCESDQGDACSTARLPAPDHELYFVDVEQSCLVLASSLSSYIALSYVWDSLESAQTTSTNLGRLMLPGSLDKVSEDFRIHAKIKDTMRFVAC